VVVHQKQVILSLVPRPPPRFCLAAVEKNWEPIFLHGYKIKSGWRLGNEAKLYSLYMCMQL